MKICTKLNTLIAVCSSALFMPGYSQTPAVPGSEASLAFQMTGYTTTPGTYGRDATGKIVKPLVPTNSNEWSVSDKSGNVIVEATEEATKILKVKISNKEILVMLMTEGVIPDITGWAFSLVCPALTPDQAGNKIQPFLYIVKKGATPIYVGDYFDLWDYSSADYYLRQTTTKFKYDAQGNVLASVYAEAGAASSSSAVYTTFSTENGHVRDEAVLQLNGILQSSLALKNFGSVAAPDFRFVAGNFLLYNISGGLQTYTKLTDTQTSSVVDGKWAAKFRILPDISANYPEAAAFSTP